MCVSVDTFVCLFAFAFSGGRNISTEKNRMGFSGRGIPTLDILVGTPGRLIDHIDNTPGFAGMRGTYAAAIHRTDLKSLLHLHF